MQTEGDPEGRPKRILEAEEAEADENGLPDPNRADRDTDRESPYHPPAVVHDVVAANGQDGQRQAGQEPEAKDDCSGGLKDPAEGIQDAKTRAKTPDISADAASTRPSRRWKV
jgi:hypothetical protein